MRKVCVALFGFCALLVLMPSVVLGQDNLQDPQQVIYAGEDGQPFYPEVGYLRVPGSPAGQANIVAALFVHRPGYGLWTVALKLLVEPEMQVYPAYSNSDTASYAPIPVKNEGVVNGHYLLSLQDGGGKTIPSHPRVRPADLDLNYHLTPSDTVTLVTNKEEDGRVVQVLNYATECRQTSWEVEILYKCEVFAGGYPEWSVNKGFLLNTEGNFFAELRGMGNDGVTLHLEIWIFSDPNMQTMLERASAVGVEEEEVPRGFDLAPVFPNPFNHEATVSLVMEWPQHVQVVVYDALGREVQVLHKGHLPVGRHKFSLRGDRLPSGPYFVRAMGKVAQKTQIAILEK